MTTLLEPKKLSRLASSRHRMSAIMETLEERQLFSLLGIGAELGVPSSSLLGTGAGTVAYSASTHTFTITGAPVTMFLGAGASTPVNSPSGFNISINVDNAGNASSGATPLTDVTLSGNVTIGNTTYNGTLITGTLEAFGFQNSGGSGADNFDFQFHVTGGQLAGPFFTGKDIGVAVADEDSNFVDFTTNFSADTVKGLIGPVPGSGSAPIVISGHKYVDQTGNGLSSDDLTHPLAGVEIDLYNSANVKVASQLTDSNGAYAFVGLTADTYTVKEVVGSGYVQTGPTAGLYTVVATSGAYTGNDFDNFATEDCPITCIKYNINGSCNSTTSLSGVKQGDTIKVTFTIPDADTVTFVSYTAPDNYFNANDASQQQIFDVATGVYTKGGTYSLTIKVPNCYFQVDLVCGYAIDKFGPANSNIFYHAEDRWHDGVNGGTTPCTYGTTPPNGSIAGSVYLDCNNDGVKQSTESGISGVKVTLTGTTKTGTNVTLTTTTDSSGNYKFSNLADGTYKVSETDPDGYDDGKDTAGSLGGTATNDIISGIMIVNGADGVSYNFGELKTSTVCGNTGHSGCKVTFTGCDHNGHQVCYTTTTDSCGNYSFSNVCNGSYSVSECDSHSKSTGYCKTTCVDWTSQGGTCRVDPAPCNNVSSLISALLAFLKSF